MNSTNQKQKSNHGVLAILIWCMSGMVGLSSCGLGSPSYIETTDKTASLVIISGLSMDIYQEELAGGSLMNIGAFAEEAVQVNQGVSSFPSVHGYDHYPFITGMHAYESAIYGNQWYDRSRKRNNVRNYDGKEGYEVINQEISRSFKTLYEFTDQFYTSSVNCIPNRGVHDPAVTKPQAGSYYEEVSATIDLSIAQLIDNPKVQGITISALAEYGLKHGKDEEYRKLLIHIDREIGRFLTAADSSGQADRLIAIVSDHGIQEATTYLPMTEFAKKYIKLDLYDHSDLRFDEKITEEQAYLDKDGYILFNGNQSAYWYMAKQEVADKSRWGQKLVGNQLMQYKKDGSIADVAGFGTKIKGIDLVAFQFEDLTVGVGREKTKAVISKNPDNTYNYYPAGGDPLMLGSVDFPLIKLTMEEIENMSLGKRYPMALPLIYELMTQPGSPDVMMTALPGYSFYPEDQGMKGGTGSLTATSTIVPYLIKIPGTGPASIDVATSADIGVTIMEYLEVQTGYPLSGESILKGLRE